MFSVLKQVSVFDSSVQAGDAVWESVRVYNGKIFLLDRYTFCFATSCVRVKGVLLVCVCSSCVVPSWAYRSWNPTTTRMADQVGG